VQAEQILATACENESDNAKRMRLGMEPVSQPMPTLPAATVSNNHVRRGGRTHLSRATKFFWQIDISTSSAWLVITYRNSRLWHESDDTTGNRNILSIDLKLFVFVPDEDHTCLLTDIFLNVMRD